MTYGVLKMHFFFLSQMYIFCKYKGEKVVKFPFRNSNIDWVIKKFKERIWVNFHPSHTLVQWRLNVLYSFGDRGLEEGTWWRFMHSDVYSFDSHDLAGNQSTCLCTTVPVRSSTCRHSGTGEQPWPLGQHLNCSAWCQWGPGLGNKHLPPFAVLQGHIWLHSEIQVSNVNLQLNSTRSNEFTWFQTVDWGNCLCGKQKNQICLPVSDCWSKKPSSVLCSLQVNLVHWYMTVCIHE